MAHTKLNNTRVAVTAAVTTEYREIKVAQVPGEVVLFASTDCRLIWSDSKPEVATNEFFQLEANIYLTWVASTKKLWVRKGSGNGSASVRALF